VFYVGFAHAVALQREYDARFTQEIKKTVSFRTFPVCTANHLPEKNLSPSNGVRDRVVHIFGDFG